MTGPAAEGSRATGTTVVETAEELQALLGGAPGERSITKELASLHPYHRAWIERSPFVVLATTGADGTCDASPKGDPAGFALVLDDRTVVLPERPGNRRGDSFHNVLEHPYVGLLFVVPGRGETLRLNGTARLVRDAPYFDRLVVRGHLPVLALEVTVEQVYFHCSKALKRSALWEPDTWGDPAALPGPAALAKDVANAPESLEELEAHYGPSYDDLLYRA